ICPNSPTAAAWRWPWRRWRGNRIECDSIFGGTSIGVVLTLLAVVAISAWPIKKWLGVRAVNAALFEKTKALVDKNPQLQPAWDEAMQDGVLTWSEARDIWEKAGQKLEPED